LRYVSYYLRSMPGVSIYVREKNYEKLRRLADQQNKSVGRIINEVLEKNL
jgi:predicted CopG family antitoxin